MRYWVKMCSNKFLKLWFLLNLGIKKLSVLDICRHKYRDHFAYNNVMYLGRLAE